MIRWLVIVLAAFAGMLFLSQAFPVLQTGVFNVESYAIRWYWVVGGCLVVLFHKATD